MEKDSSSRGEKNHRDKWLESSKPSRGYPCGEMATKSLCSSNDDDDDGNDDDDGGDDDDDVGRPQTCVLTDVGGEKKD